MEETLVAELAHDIHDNSPLTFLSSEDLAEELYQAGYRKQTEGIWIAKDMMIRTITALNHVCSVCDTEGHCTPYCPNCGAKMTVEKRAK